MQSLSFIESFERLIGTPSVSSFEALADQSNQPVVALLSSLFADFGFDITMQPVPNSRGKVNMLARVGHGKGGLLLSGHTDTVGFDEGRWHQDPFIMRQADNRLYGLGACDMKGFFAFILEALKDVPLTLLKKPLYILATADEETSMAGARFFASEQLISPDMAVIGEPTELKPIMLHKGHMAHSLVVQGQAGHSSDPDGGVNAIEIMNKAISQLLELKQRLKQRSSDARFSVPVSTLNLGHIHGGDSENRICGHCQLNFDVRPLPDLPDEEAIKEIDRVLSPVMRQFPGRVTRTMMYPSAPAFACKNETGIIELAERLTGFEAQTANYATEGPFINQLGCDTLILGPGSIKQAHQPNEYMSLSYVEPTVGLIRKLIQNVCG